MASGMDVPPLQVGARDFRDLFNFRIHRFSNIGTIRAPSRGVRVDSKRFTRHSLIIKLKELTNSGEVLGNAAQCLQNFSLPSVTYIIDLASTTSLVM